MKLLKQKTHKFTVEEVLSSLDTDKYEYFITGKEKNGKILEQCGICLRTGIPALDSHLKSHFELVPCAGRLGCLKLVAQVHFTVKCYW